MSNNDASENVTALSDHRTKEDREYWKYLDRISDGIRLTANAIHAMQDIGLDDGAIARVLRHAAEELRYVDLRAYTSGKNDRDIPF